MKDKIKQAIMAAIGLSIALGVWALWDFLHGVSG